MNTKMIFLSEERALFLNWQKDLPLTAYRLQLLLFHNEKTAAFRRRQPLHHLLFNCID